MRSFCARWHLLKSSLANFIQLSLKPAYLRRPSLYKVGLNRGFLGFLCSDDRGSPLEEEGRHFVRSRERVDGIAHLQLALPQQRFDLPDQSVTTASIASQCRLGRVRARAVEGRSSWTIVGLRRTTC